MNMHTTNTIDIHKDNNEPQQYTTIHHKTRPHTIHTTTPLWRKCTAAVAPFIACGCAIPQSTCRGAFVCQESFMARHAVAPQSTCRHALVCNNTCTVAIDSSSSWHPEPEHCGDLKALRQQMQADEAVRDVAAADGTCAEDWIGIDACNANSRSNATITINIINSSIQHDNIAIHVA